MAVSCWAMGKRVKYFTLPDGRTASSQRGRSFTDTKARNASTRIRLGVSELSTLGPWVCARRSRGRSRQGSLSRSFGVGPWSAAPRLRLGFAARSWFTTAQPLSRTKLLPDNVGPAALGAVLDRCEVNVASIGRARCVLTPLTNHGSPSVLGRANTCTEASCSRMPIDACLVAHRLLR